jgi:hypothetical protein
MAKYRIIYYKEDYIEIEAQDASELRRKTIQCAPFDYDYCEAIEIETFEGEDGEENA